MIAADHSAFKHHRVVEQNLLELSRVNVGASGDDHVLGAILERENAFAIGEPHITRPEPAVAEGLFVGLGVIPIAAHDTVGPGYSRADFASRQLTTIVVDDQNVHTAARHAAGSKDLLSARMVFLAEQPL